MSSPPVHTQCSRRCVLLGALACALAPLTCAAAPALGNSVDASGAPDPARKARPQPGDVLVHADGERAGRPLAPADIVEGAAPLSAWPMIAATRQPRDASRLNLVRVLRLPEAALSERTRTNAAAGGIVAYAGMCSHAGCDVTGWSADARHLLCPCHSSEFDAADAATVISGPAPRPLAMLPLRIEPAAAAGDAAKQVIVVARGFTRQVGFKPA